MQVLADAAGNVIHLFDRDCSVQRRHQKVVELAPAPNLDPDLRERICADAVAFARSIGYVNAGTVEFLVDRAGRHVFIEMNPRIQVEHTVTEEVTDVDLVQAQLRIAAGETLPGIGPVAGRDRAARRRAAVPHHHRGPGQRLPARHRPHHRLPLARRRRRPAGRRHLRSGAEIEAHFDSLLVKLTCRGRDLPTAIRRARRALAEFRIRGVPTNIAFLTAVLDDPDFQAGRVTTSFIEDHPGLLAPRIPGDRGTKLLTYLADVTVNRPHGQPPRLVDPVDKLPGADLGAPAARRVTAAAPRRWARRSSRGNCAARRRWRSPTPRSATPTSRCWPPGCAARTCWRFAGHVARTVPQLLSLEAWGGATYDVALRYLHEDPWERLARDPGGGAQHLPADAAARP